MTVTRVRVVQGGFLTLVQDHGRWGYEHWGVAVNGYLDEFAARWANWLLGNDESTALLEITAAGPDLEVLADGPLVWTGAPFPVRIDHDPWPPGQSRMVHRGSRIRFGYRESGLRAYLAFPGGINVPQIMGSRATDVAAGIGGHLGRGLRPGDEIGSVTPGAPLSQTDRYTWRKKRVLRVLPGARPERLAPQALTRLVTEQFRVARDSSAMGLRLLGAPLDHPRGDWASEGMPIGAIECPPSGEPLVLLRNRGSIGGYPVVAHVIRADWPALAQLGPDDVVLFDLVDMSAARAALVGLFSGIGGGQSPRLRSSRAPWAGIVQRRDAYGRVLAAAGEWAERGQTLLMLEALGQRIPMRMERSGQILDIAEDDAWVEAGDVLWNCHEEDESA